MKAIYGNLNTTKKYTYVDFLVGQEFDYKACENCGAIIKNVAVVKDNDGKCYSIGFDCAEALTNLGNPLDLVEAKKKIKKNLKIIKFLKTEAKSAYLSQGTCYVFRRIVTGFEVGAIWRLDYNKYKSFFEKFGILVIRRAGE